MNKRDLMKRAVVLPGGSLASVARQTPRLLLLSVTLLAGVLTLTACSGTSGTAEGGASSQTSAGDTQQAQPSEAGASSILAGTGAPATGAFNDADVAFARGMILLHQQAVRMADMAMTQADSSEVKRLAGSIKAAQGSETETMSGWLTGWGKPVPDATEHTMDTMGVSVDGMMSDEAMTALSKASGPAFDRDWVTGMIAHHKGAVAMAQIELKDGSSAAAKQLAEHIITSQSAEITQMQGLVTSLPQ
ncbi:MAG: DUF305 domain-containing protein [Acidobacteriota bacterium]